MDLLISLVRGTNTGPGADGSKPTGGTLTLQVANAWWWISSKETTPFGRSFWNLL